MTKADLRYIEERLHELHELEDLSDSISSSRLVLIHDNHSIEVPIEEDKKLRALFESDINLRINEINKELAMFTGHNPFILEY